MDLLKVLTLILIGFWLHLALATDNFRACEAALRTEKAQFIETKDLGGGKVSIVQTFGHEALENDLFIGFNGGTVYVSHRGKRFFGGSVFQYKPSFSKDSKSLDHGLIIRVRDLTDGQSQQVLELFEVLSGKLFLTCADGACEVLKQTGLSEGRGFFQTPVSSYHKIKEELADLGIEFESYVVGYESERRFTNAARIGEYAIGISWALPGAVLLAIVTGNFPQFF